MPDIQLDYLPSGIIRGSLLPEAGLLAAARDGRASFHEHLERAQAQHDDPPSATSGTDPIEPPPADSLGDPSQADAGPSPPAENSPSAGPHQDVKEAPPQEAPQAGMPPEAALPQGEARDTAAETLPADQSPKTRNKSKQAKNEKDSSGEKPAVAAAVDGPLLPNAGLVGPAQPGKPATAADERAEALAQSDAANATGAPAAEGKAKGSAANPKRAPAVREKQAAAELPAEADTAAAGQPAAASKSPGNRVGHAKEGAEERPTGPSAKDHAGQQPIELIEQRLPRESQVKASEGPRRASRQEDRKAAPASQLEPGARENLTTASQPAATTAALKLDGAKAPVQTVVAAVEQKTKNAADAADEASRDAAGARAAVPSRPAAARLSPEGAPAQASPAEQSSPADRVRFVQRVAKAFQALAGRGGMVRLRLSPPELGALRIEVSVRDGVMTARLQAENATTRHLLLDNLPALRDRLAEQQIKIEQFQVDLMDRSFGGLSDPMAQQGTSQEQQRQYPAFRPAVSRAPENAAAPTPRLSRPGNASQLDVIV